MADEKEHICANCGEEIYLKEGFMDKRWYHKKTACRYCQHLEATPKKGKNAK